MSTASCARPIWTALPDELICMVMGHYKIGLRERMALRQPVPLYFGTGKTYCEVCNRKKKKVAWFRNSFQYNGHSVYSACPSCMSRIVR